MADTAWTIGWSIFSFAAGAVISHQAAVFRDKRREFNDLARPFQDWIAVHLERNEGYDLAPGPAARSALAARLSADDAARFVQQLAIVEREYKKAARVSISGRILKERTPQAFNALLALQEITQHR